MNYFFITLTHYANGVGCKMEAKGEFTFNALAATFKELPADKGYIQVHIPGADISFISKEDYSKVKHALMERYDFLILD